MDAERYLELQYITLRKEIEECLTRSFQIMIGGATLIPIIAGVADKYAATPIMIALPMVVVITALMYLNQWSMIMRAGRYIRTEIESRLDAPVGWETWLEARGTDQATAVDNRLVDRYIALAFYILASAYFFAASWVGFLYARDHLHYGLSWVVLGVYCLTAVAMLIVLLRRVPTTTTTKAERTTSLTSAVLNMRQEKVVTRTTVEFNNASAQGTATESVEQTRTDLELALARDHAEDLATPDRVFDEEEEPTGG